jgi:hypothetical protein
MTAYYVTAYYAFGQEPVSRGLLDLADAVSVACGVSRLPGVDCATVDKCVANVTTVTWQRLAYAHGECVANRSYDPPRYRYVLGRETGEQSGVTYEPRHARA